MTFFFKVGYNLANIKERDTMKKINLNVKPDTYKAFQALCEERGTNVSAVVRAFMTEELRKAKFEKTFKAEKK